MLAARARLGAGELDEESLEAVAGGRSIDWVRHSGQLAVPTHDFVSPPTSGQFWITLTLYDTVDATDQLTQATTR